MSPAKRGRSATLASAPGRPAGRQREGQHAACRPRRRVADARCSDTEIRERAVDQRERHDGVHCVDDEQDHHRHPRVPHAAQRAGHGVERHQHREAERARAQIFDAERRDVRLRAHQPHQRRRQREDDGGAEDPPHKSGDDRGVQAQLHPRAVACANVAGDDRSGADIDPPALPPGGSRTEAPRCRPLRVRPRRHSAQRARRRRR